MKEELTLKRRVEIKFYCLPLLRRLNSRMFSHGKRTRNAEETVENGPTTHTAAIVSVCVFWLPEKLARTLGNNPLTAYCRSCIVNVLEKLYYIVAAKL